MAIQVSGITKQFGTYRALDSVDLEVRSGELLALLGPSGSGKTTLLRIMAGLESPDAGSLQLNGEEALGLKPRDRQVGFVFQHYALFRHMTVFDNVAFGLKVRPRAQRLPSAEIKRRVMELLELVQLGHFAERYPAQLSGGQRQRVALARALAIEPKVLLLDEPFGALDAKVRKELRRWLRHLHEEVPVTSVLVTHDQEEALELADRIVVMGRGKIEQVGSPGDVYQNPATAFVHDFIGETVALPGEVRNGLLYLKASSQGLDSRGAPDGPAQILARPHEVELAEPDAAPVSGRVLALRTFGPNRRADVQIAGHQGNVVIEASVPLDRKIEVGARVGLLPQRYHVFPTAGA